MSMSKRERRTGGDRRSWQKTPAMPFLDCHSVLVKADRRKQPDRRLNNIQVRWLAGHRDREVPSEGQAVDERRQVGA